MITNILLLLIIMSILQFIIKYFLEDIQLEPLYKKLIIFIPFGLGLFMVQNIYYEPNYPNWEVPYQEKLRLKYIYLLTFLEFVALYVCIFVI
ncbi:hypothetical protein ACUXSI_001109 [Staphylococcus hominis]